VLGSPFDQTQRNNFKLGKSIHCEDVQQLFCDCATSKTCTAALFDTGDLRSEPLLGASSDWHGRTRHLFHLSIIHQYEMERICYCMTLKIETKNIRYCYIFFIGCFKNCVIFLLKHNTAFCSVNANRNVSFVLEFKRHQSDCIRKLLFPYIKLLKKITLQAQARVNSCDNNTLT